MGCACHGSQVTAIPETFDTVCQIPGVCREVRFKFTDKIMVFGAHQVSEGTQRLEVEDLGFAQISRFCFVSLLPQGG